MLKNFLKDYFSYSRRERRGIITLLAIILVIIFIHLLLPYININQNFNYEEYENQLKDFEKSLKPLNRQKQYDAKEYSGMSYGNQHKQFRFNYSATGINDANSIQDEEYGSDIATEDAVIVNINNADRHIISGLLGKEDLLSERIIKYRNLLGGFTSKNQLNEVYGIKKYQYYLIANNVFIDTTLIRKININSADEQILNRHPYLNKYYAKAIMKYKKFAGEIKNINELSVNNILPENIFCQIKPYLSVN
ncbi:MAG: helix-hairpin-helix domain-containing protein [Bacteroidales bacterium]|nr:MAG: helix-hairpin-helix domain-containing protein [Bacteroidales bacterium]